MGDECLLTHLDLIDCTLRQVDLKQHGAVVHDSSHRCTAIYLCLVREMRKIDNNTVKRGTDIHLLQIHLGVLIVQTGVHDLDIGVLDFRQCGTTLLIERFCLGLFLLGKLQVKTLGLNRDTVLIRFVLNTYNESSLLDPVTKFVRFTGCGVFLKMILAGHLC